MTTLLLIAAMLSPVATPTKRFDRVDVNHYHDPATGELRFTQLIYWRWSRCERRFSSFGFTMEGGVVDGPRWNGRGYEFIVKRNGDRWRVQTPAVIESWTTYDPEAVDRLRFPDVEREG